MVRRGLATKDSLLLPHWMLREHRSPALQLRPTKAVPFPEHGPTLHPPRQLRQRLSRRNSHLPARRLATSVLRPNSRLVALLEQPPAMVVCRILNTLRVKQANRNNQRTILRHTPTSTAGMPPNSSSTSKEPSQEVNMRNINRSTAKHRS